METLIKYSTKWSIEETKYLRDLKIKGKNLNEIYILFNNKFTTQRTKDSIEKKIESIFKVDYNFNMDKIIVENVIKYPLNLQYAFEITAKILNKNYPQKDKLFTKQVIQGRYYSYIKHNYNIITTGSKIGFSINIKNQHKDKNKILKQNLTSFQVLIKEILNLSDDERKKIITLLTN
jgi:hypothetical protein